MFVLLFLSSASLPRDLIEQDWFQTAATINPVSYLIEGVRSLFVTGWDGEALALGFGVAIAIFAVGARAPRRRDGREDGAHVTAPPARRAPLPLGRAHGRLAPHALGVPQRRRCSCPRCSSRCSSTWRSRAGCRPSATSPGFDYYDYNAFQFVFVLLQSAAFGGVFIGFSIGADFDSGFTRRLFLAAARPLGGRRRLRRRRGGPRADGLGDGVRDRAGDRDGGRAAAASTSSGCSGWRSSSTSPRSSSPPG